MDYKKVIVKLMEDNLNLVQIVQDNKNLIDLKNQLVDSLENDFNRLRTHNTKLINDNLKYREDIKELKQIQETFKKALEDLKISYEELLNEDTEKLKQEKVKEIQEQLKNNDTPYTIIMIDPYKDKCILALQNFDIKKYKELVLEINNVETISIDLKNQKLKTK